MSIGKQSKILTDKQVEVMVSYLSSRRNGLRNRVIFLLSLKSGLRSKEISGLRWSMVVGPDGEVGDTINLTNEVSKGRSGRIIPLNRILKQSLHDLLMEHREVPNFDIHTGHLVRTERQDHTSPQSVVNMFQRWYREVGFVGCSSHSGRRTFITNTSRKIGLVGGSLRDVQVMVGHKNLQTTQRYIDYDTECQRRVVDLV
jgi:integrase